LLISHNKRALVLTSHNEGTSVLTSHNEGTSIVTSHNEGNISSLTSQNERNINSFTSQNERRISSLTSHNEEITKKYTQGRVTLCDHATSIMKVVPSKIQNIYLTKANESLHSRTLLCHVEDRLRYLIHRLKDWHEIMFTHKCL